MIIENVEFENLKKISKQIKILQSKVLLQSFNLDAMQIKEITDDRFNKLSVNLENNNCKLAIAINNEEVIVGYVWFFELEVLGEMHVHINEIGTLENHRNLGIGSSLMNHVLEYCKLQNINHVELNVSAKNLQAVKFYENKQFEIESYKLIKQI